MRKNPHPNASGVKNYKNTPYDKVYMVEIFVGNETPASAVKVTVLDSKTGKMIVVPYGKHIDPQYIGGGFLIGPPSIPAGTYGQISLGPYKSRRAAAIDAKSIVQQLLRGVEGAGKSADDGTILEMYELTDSGQRYMQKRKYPPSVLGAPAQGTDDRNPIVIGYVGQLGTNHPIYARIYTILPSDKSKKAKEARQGIRKPFSEAWKQMGVSASQIKKAKEATNYDLSEGYDIKPNPSNTTRSDFEMNGLKNLSRNNPKEKTRKQKENAIAGKVPPDSKRGRGAKREVMLTGNMATILGKDQYTVVKLSHLTDREIDKLYHLLVRRKNG